MGHWQRFVADIADPSSKTLRKIESRIQRQVAGRMERQHCTGWGDMKVTVSVKKIGNDTQVTTTGTHSSGLELQPHVRLYKNMSFPADDLTWPQAKDHFERTLIREGGTALIEATSRPRDKRVLGIDRYLYDYMRRWLDNSQILEFTKSFKNWSYKIVAYPDCGHVGRFATSTKGMVITAKFQIADRLTYDNGQVHISGQYPVILADSLVGRPIYSVIEAEPFKDRGKIIVAGRQKDKLRLVLERETITIDELTILAREEKRGAFTHAVYAN